MQWQGFRGVAEGRCAHGSQDSRNAVQSRSDCQIRFERVFGNFPKSLMSAPKLTRSCCVMHHQSVQNEPLAIFFELVRDSSFLSCQMSSTFSAHMHLCPLDSPACPKVVRIYVQYLQHSFDDNFPLFVLMTIFQSNIRRDIVQKYDGEWKGSGNSKCIIDPIFGGWASKAQLLVFEYNSFNIRVRDLF